MAAAPLPLLLCCLPLLAHSLYIVRVDRVPDGGTPEGADDAEEYWEVADRAQLPEELEDGQQQLLDSELAAELEQMADLAEQEERRREQTERAIDLQELVSRWESLDRAIRAKIEGEERPKVPLSLLDEDQLAELLDGGGADEDAAQQLVLVRRPTREVLLLD